jgi:hypothetical protein
MQYEIVATHAQNILTGQTPLQAVQEWREEREDLDKDFSMISETDDELRFFASQQADNLELPVERLPFIEREILAMRDEARERVSWCRHIELIQDKTHTQSPQTLFLHDSKRFAHCTKLGYRSRTGNPDWKAVFRTFRREYCVSCRYRQPKFSLPTNRDSTEDQDS